MRDERMAKMPLPGESDSHPELDDPRAHTPITDPHVYPNIANKRIARSDRPEPPSVPVDGSYADCPITGNRLGLDTTTVPGPSSAVIALAHDTSLNSLNCTSPS
jgi:hypothetical protein